MKNDLQNLTNKIMQLSTELSTKDKSHSQLEISNKDLAAKLLNSVKLCIDEKCCRQTAESKIIDLTHDLSMAKSDIVNYILKFKKNVT